TIQAHASECYRGCGRPLDVPALRECRRGISKDLARLRSSQRAGCIPVRLKPISAVPGGSPFELELLRGGGGIGEYAAPAGQRGPGGPPADIRPGGPELDREGRGGPAAAEAAGIHDDGAASAGLGALVGADQEPIAERPQIDRPAARLGVDQKERAAVRRG